MKKANEQNDGARVPPDERAWLEAQRSVAERNDRTRKLAREQREKNERRMAASQREREHGTVYR